MKPRTEVIRGMGKATSCDAMVSCIAFHLSHIMIGDRIACPGQLPAARSGASLGDETLHME
jgi:hypothetical protein